MVYFQLIGTTFDFNELSSNQQVKELSLVFVNMSVAQMRLILRSFPYLHLLTLFLTKTPDTEINAEDATSDDGEDDTDQDGTQDGTGDYTEGDTYDETSGDAEGDRQSELEDDTHDGTVSGAEDGLFQVNST